MIDIAIESKTKSDQEKLENALARLTKEDPSLHKKIEKETGQMLISGYG